MSGSTRRDLERTLLEQDGGGEGHMEPNEIEALVRELMSAYESGAMVAKPPSARPGFDLDAAYAVEATLKGWREGSGARIAGRKVGYANKAMWRILKLQTLVWGHMYDDTVHHADGNSAELALPRARSLKVEPEIVFGLKQPITAEGLDAAAALNHVDWIAIGFEVIDCPYPDWKFQPGDFVASFGLHAALVVGERVSVHSDAIASLAENLPRFKVRVSRNGEFVEEGSGKNSLGSPAACLAELGAAILRRFPNEPLLAGELVSSGTLTAGHPAAPGETWTAEVQGLPLPALKLRLD
jgi:2-keto-4-pentenoate hydratase